MADSSHSTNLLGRRALIKIFAGAAASNIAGTAADADLASTPCFPEADAQLFARWREYLKSEIELNAVQDARDVMSWNARQAYPPKPDRIASSWVKVIPSEIDADVEVCCATTDMKMGRRVADEHKAEVKA